MKLKEICHIAKGTLINKSHCSTDYTKAFASYLMSDVLRFSVENAVLTTDLSTLCCFITDE